MSSVEAPELGPQSYVFEAEDQHFSTHLRVEDHRIKVEFSFEEAPETDREWLRFVEQVKVSSDALVDIGQGYRPLPLTVRTAGPISFGVEPGASPDLQIPAPVVLDGLGQSVASPIEFLLVLEASGEGRLETWVPAELFRREDIIYPLRIDPTVCRFGPPVIGALQVVPPFSGAAGVQLSAVVQSFCGAAERVVSWGDGSTTMGTGVGGVIERHRYHQPGEYEVCLEVCASQTCTRQCRQVRVGDRDPGPQYPFPALEPCPPANEACFVQERNADGDCVLVPADAGISCDDADICTVDDRCDGTGRCHGAPRDCEVPGNCQVEACDPSIGCHVDENEPDAVPCSPASGPESGTCHDGQCVPPPCRTNLDCDDGSDCTQDVCGGFPLVCFNVPLLDERCAPVASCRADGSDCNDARECTDDVCLPTGCAHLPREGEACAEDGLACTTGVCNGDGICVTSVAPGTCLLDGQCVAEGAACSTGLLGKCAVGALSCQDGIAQCEVVNSPTPEKCNGADDDCDGAVDEELVDPPGVGQSCATGVGECEREGRFVCNADGSSLVCDASTGSPVAELCNGIDDDCDGVADGPEVCGVAPATFCEERRAQLTAVELDFFCEDFPPASLTAWDPGSLRVSDGGLGELDEGSYVGAVGLSGGHRRDLPQFGPAFALLVELAFKGEVIGAGLYRDALESPAVGIQVDVETGAQGTQLRVWEMPAGLTLARWLIPALDDEEMHRLELIRSTAQCPASEPECAWELRLDGQTQPIAEANPPTLVEAFTAVSLYAEARGATSDSSRIASLVLRRWRDRDDDGVRDDDDSCLVTPNAGDASGDACDAGGLTLLIRVDDAADNIDGVWALDVSTGVRRRIFTPSGPIHSVFPSPDGERICYAREPNEVWVADANGEAAFLRAHNRAAARWAVLSSGQRVVYSRADGLTVFSNSADSATPDERIKFPPREGVELRLVSDRLGQRLVLLERDADTTFATLLRADTLEAIDGPAAVPAVEGAWTWVAPHPTEPRLLAAVASGSASGLYEVSLEDESVERIHARATHAALYDPRGERIYAVESGGGAMRQVLSMRRDGSGLGLIHGPSTWLQPDSFSWVTPAETGPLQDRDLDGLDDRDHCSFERPDNAVDDDCDGELDEEEPLLRGEPLRLTTDQRWSRRVDTAAAPDGTYAVVVLDQPGEDVGQPVVTIFNADGTLRAGPIALLPLLGRPKVPRIRWRNGSFVVSWAAGGLNTQRLHVVRLDRDGATQQRIGPLGFAGQLRADVEFNGREYARVASNIARGRTVWFGRFDSDGQEIGSPVLVKSDDRKSPGSVSIAWSGAHWGIVYMESEQQCFRPIAADGQPLKPTRCWDDARRTEHPNLIWNGRGFAMTWRETSGLLRFVEIDDLGSTRVDHRLQTSTAGAAVNMVRFGAGYGVVWSSPEETLHFLLLGPDGRPVGETVELGVDGAQPAIAWSPDQLIIGYQLNFGMDEFGLEAFVLRGQLGAGGLRRVRP